MPKKRVFVSFDFDHDKAMKDFIIGQAKLPDSPFEILDCSLVEAAPTKKTWEKKARAAIKGADVVLVMVGPSTHKAAGVLKEVEIARQEGIPIFQVIAYRRGNHLAVPNAGRLYAWSWDNLKKLLGSAPMNRPMAHPFGTAQNPALLAGARKWLSGQIPEADSITKAQRAKILDFVGRFSARVFRQGGRIIHGSHPSFTPLLLDEARRFQAEGGHKSALVLGVSRYWSKDARNVPAAEWRKVAIVHETSEAPGDRSRHDSLDQLRQWMVSGSDAIVIVGGKWWQLGRSRPGIPLELALAQERGLPCFLLGGLGGAAQDFVAHHLEMFAQLKNGLDPAANCALSTQKDVGKLVDAVCQQLERLPLVRGRRAVAKASRRPTLTWD